MNQKNALFVFLTFFGSLNFVDAMERGTDSTENVFTSDRVDRLNNFVHSDVFASYKDVKSFYENALHELKTNKKDDLEENLENKAEKLVLNEYVRRVNVSSKDKKKELISGKESPQFPWSNEEELKKKSPEIYQLLRSQWIESELSKNLHKSEVEKSEMKWENSLLKKENKALKSKKFTTIMQETVKTLPAIALQGIVSGAGQTVGQVLGQELIGLVVNLGFINYLKHGPLHQNTIYSQRQEVQHNLITVYFGDVDMNNGKMHKATKGLFDIHNDLIKFCNEDIKETLSWYVKESQTELMTRMPQHSINDMVLNLAYAKKIAAQQETLMYTIFQLKDKNITEKQREVLQEFFDKTMIEQSRIFRQTKIGDEIPECNAFKVTILAGLGAASATGIAVAAQALKNFATSS